VLGANSGDRGHTPGEDRCNSGIRCDRHEAVGPEGGEDKISITCLATVVSRLF
jgi:hypothetical protein